MILNKIAAFETWTAHLPFMPQFRAFLKKIGLLNPIKVGEFAFFVTIHPDRGRGDNAFLFKTLGKWFL